MRAQVPIVIDDVNDHRPTFERSTYRVTISEDAAPNSEVIQLTATDGDASAKNRNLAFRISGAESTESLRKFKITQTGALCWFRYLTIVYIRAGVKCAFASASK